MPHVQQLNVKNERKTKDMSQDDFNMPRSSGGMEASGVVAANLQQQDIGITS